MASGDVLGGEIMAEVKQDAKESKIKDNDLAYKESVRIKKSLENPKNEDEIVEDLYVEMSYEKLKEK